MENEIYYTITHTYKINCIPKSKVIGECKRYFSTSTLTIFRER